VREISMSSNEFKKLQEIIKRLTPKERRVLEYMIRNISVGEIIAVRELRSLYRIEDPEIILARLIELGLIQRGLACYNLSPMVKKAIKEHKIKL